MSKFNAALLQTRVYDNKERNINNAVQLIKKVSEEGADIARKLHCCITMGRCGLQNG
jgi:hypothetical protein